MKWLSRSDFRKISFKSFVLLEFVLFPELRKFVMHLLSAKFYYFQVSDSLQLETFGLACFNALNYVPICSGFKYFVKSDFY